MGGIVIVGFIGFLYWQYNNDADVASDIVPIQNETESDKYERRSEAIISQLTEEYGGWLKVLYKYPGLSKYCAFTLVENETEYLLIYDLEQEVLKRFENYNLQTTNAGEICLPYYSLSMNESGDKILIRGNNGANSIGYTEYLLELDPSSWKIREFCSGLEIKESENGYIADRIIISLSFHTNGNIYGTYYYNKRGSDNKLYLYGGASANEDMVLLEFTESGQQTGIFKGRLTSRALEGTFTNNAGVEMPFELYLSNGSSSNTTLKRYYNSRFGYSILYPSSFNIIKEPENGDGCRFSKDNNTYLSVWGMYNSLDETLEEVYNQYKSKSPAYYRIKDNWFVISDNTDNGYIFYQKTVLKDGVFMTAVLHYPSNENDYYSALIPKIFTKFPN